MNKVHLILINVPSSEWTASLEADVRTTGRGGQAAIRVPARCTSVSRVHARVSFDSGEGLVEDLGSTHGTRINGIRIPPGHPEPVKLDDRLTLGMVEFLLVDQSGVDQRIVQSLGPNEESDAAIAGCRASADGANSLAGPTLLDCLSHAERAVVMWIMRGVTADQELSELLHRSPIRSGPI
jgi:predicted component of type VI protein secretion system